MHYSCATHHSISNKGTLILIFKCQNIVNHPDPVWFWNEMSRLVQCCTTGDRIQLHFWCGNLTYDLVSTEPWYHRTSVAVCNPNTLQHIVSLGTVEFISHVCCSFGNTHLNFNELSTITQELHWVKARGRFLWCTRIKSSGHGYVLNPFSSP